MWRAEDEPCPYIGTERHNQSCRARSPFQLMYYGFCKLILDRPCFDYNLDIVMLLSEMARILRHLIPACAIGMTINMAIILYYTIMSF